jgi:hypothetical protein
VTTEDEVMGLLRRADPDGGRADAPAVDGTDFLAALRARSTTMTLIATEPASTQPDGRHRWPIIAVAAATVVAIAVGALMLADRDDSTPPVPADTVAPDVPEVTAADEEIARGFVDAYAANDADQALNYITEGAITEMWGSTEEFRGEIAWNEATGFKMMINNCEPGDGDPVAGITLRCGFDFHMLGSDALGNGPFRDNYWDLTIRDGQIVVAERQTPTSNGWNDLAWNAVQLWIKAEHPDDVLVLYTDESQGSRRFTEDALQAWEQRTQEYVQTVLSRRVSYPADVGAICTTRGPQLAEVAVPTDGTLEQVATENTAGAAVLKQTNDELTALEEPMSTDMSVYKDFRLQLFRLGRIAEDSAEAATTGDSTRLAELNTQYDEVRQAMTSGPAGSGLEDCLASLPG